MQRIWIRLLGLVCTTLLLATGCGESSNFAGQQSTRGSSDAPADPGVIPEANGTPGDENPAAETDPNNGQTEADAVADNGPDTLQSICEQAALGDFTQVVTIAGNDTDVALEPDSVVYLKASGNSDLELAADNVASIRGICIEATGGSSITLDTSLVVSGLYVDAGGQSDVIINFGTTGELAELISDARGSAQLILTGDLIDCDLLQVTVNGQPNISCNGAAPGS